MQLGMIGLGRMGANMTRRLLRGGHRVVVYDRSADAVHAATAEGATGSGSLRELVSALVAPRACAALITPKLAFWPGTGRSLVSSAVICRNTPESGPPL